MIITRMFHRFKVRSQSHFVRVSNHFLLLWSFVCLTPLYPSNHTHTYTHLHSQITKHSHTSQWVFFFSFFVVKHQSKLFLCIIGLHIFSYFIYMDKYAYYGKSVGVFLLSFLFIVVEYQHKLFLCIIG